MFHLHFDLTLQRILIETLHCSLFSCPRRSDCEARPLSTPQQYVCRPQLDVRSTAALEARLVPPDMIRCFFSNHDGGSIGVAGAEVWHDRGVRDAQSHDPTNTKIGIENRPFIVAYF